METKKIIVKSVIADYEDDMKLKEIDVEYMFVNETWETSQAWGHKSTLLRNGIEYSSNKIRYYNRTWEEYRYKSCMSCCITDLMVKRYNTLLSEYKEKHDIKRVSQAIRNTFELNVLGRDRLYNEYKQVKEEL